jgi:steroid 5-alpha reductase family enzyme
MFNDPVLGEEVTYDFFLWPLVTVFAGNLLLGVIVQLCGKKDNSWIDAWWSVSFLLPNIVVFILRAVKGGDAYAITARMWLITACEAIWSLRLSTYIFIRHKREDWRY